MTPASSSAPFRAGLLLLGLFALATQAADPAPTPPASPSHFQKVVLAQNCADPMELAVAPDGRVFWVERHGHFKVWDPATQTNRLIAKFDVWGTFNGSKEGSWEDGLLGIALDPGFANNQWIWLYYSPTNGAENRLSRFTLRGEHLDRESEKIVLRVATQRDICCHAAGSLAFDGQGNLFLSIGDNTNPFESEGFAPIDDRPGRYPWDASKSSANTADLRGKILRIHPEPDGSYTIPAGNLFPPGTPKTRPEIFVMGCRNPFRISVDRTTQTLYWGEVGPDAQGLLADRGPAGFDEVNRTQVAGNFGWPFFVADNKPYRAWDFGAKKAGDAFDPKHPINASANNTGLKDLPPAQPAWIFYPYAPSVRFPIVGSGGRSACAGPVYHFNEALASPRKLPREFDNTLFIYDWMRHWIVAVKLDAKGERVSMERFAADIPLKRPAEMELGPDGCLYAIEFGTAWEKNTDSQVVRIEYADPSAGR